MEISPQDIMDIRERLVRIEESLKHPSPQCAVHSSKIDDIGDRVDSIEAQIGRHNLIAATLGALAAGIVLMIKYVAGRG